MRRTATRIHQFLVALWLVGAVAAFFLAGLGIFEATKTSKLGSGTDVKLAAATTLDPHRVVGDLEILIALLVLFAALAARTSRRQVAVSGALFLLMIVQSILANLGVDNGALFGALHPVNGLLMLGIAGHLLVSDRRALAAAPATSSGPSVTDPPGTASPGSTASLS